MDALHGFARTAQTLHLYEESLETYQKALRLDPENGLLRQDYVGALAWGGLLKGRRDWIDRAMEEGHRALLVDPDRPAIYDHLLTAIQETAQLELYGQLLEDVARAHPSSPVLDVKRLEFELHQAESTGEEERAESVRDVLRARLAEGDAADSTLERGEVTAAPELYRRAVLHRLLGEREDML